MEADLREELLAAWIRLSSTLKGSRMTQNMSYNEAIVMKLVLDQYRKDGVGRTAVQSILKETRMLKSLVNRTVNSLCQQGYLTKERDEADARTLFVRPREERLPDFLAIHAHSLELAQKIIDVIGPEDAAQFTRISQKFLAADLTFS